MGKKTLPRPNLNLFREKVVSVPSASDEDLDIVYTWWASVKEKGAWIVRFKAAIATLPTGSPEREDANRAFAGCEEAFEAINGKLLLLLDHPGDNPILTYFTPLISWVWKSSRISVLADLVQLIESFDEKYWITENDQILALAEAFGQAKNPKMARILIAQWVVEEWVILIPRQKLFEVHAVGDDLSTIDELDIEKRELAEAIASTRWSPEESAKFRRIFNRIRKAMDTLNLPTQAKRDFNLVWDYASGRIGASVSAIDILARAEKAWLTFKKDSDVRSFWDWEEERLLGDEGEE